MTFADLQFTGIQSVDVIINLVLKLICGVVFIVMLFKASKFYSSGSYPQLGLSVLFGLFLVAGMLGFQNVINWTTSLSEVFQAVGSGGGSGAGTGKGK